MDSFKTWLTYMANTNIRDLTPVLFNCIEVKPVDSQTKKLNIKAITKKTREST